MTLVHYTPPPPKSQVSTLDWALLSLLQSVRSEFVDQLITHWCDGIRDHEKFEPHELDQKRRFMHNLDCALKLATHAPTDGAPKLTHHFDHWDNKKADRLAARLQEDGHRLFNSYYYITIDTYGDPEEYFFFPIVPGHTTLAKDGSCDEIERFRSYLDRLDLPFQPIGRRFEEYTGTLLPGSVGLTPQICRIAKTKKKNDPNYVFETPITVPHFLGDFAILGKAEDAAQRHLSALVAPFIDGNRCLGAFLLSCSVPDAFSYCFKERDIGANLQHVVNRWVESPLENLHAVARAESRDAEVALHWPDLDKANENNPTPLSPISLVRAAEDWLLELGRTKGATALFSRDSDSSSTLAAVNADALVMTVKSTLSPGPLLSPSVYTRADFEPVPAVSHGAMLNLIEGIREIRELAVPTPLEQLKAFNALLRDFHKLGAVPHQLTIQTSRYDGVCAAAIFDGAGPGGLARELQEICKHVADTFSGEGSLLPGERHSIYPQLEAAHHRASHGSATSTAANPAAVTLYEKVDALLSDKSVVGVMLFEDTEIFVADACNGWHQDLSAAVFNPASYWVFEQICQLATQAQFPTDRVGLNTEFYNPAPFVALSPGGPAITVGFCGEPKANHEYASALNYLGVPVSVWLDDGVPGADLKVVVTNGGAHLAEFYRGYLAQLLLNAQGVRAIRRAVETAHGSEDAVIITKVELDAQAARPDLVSLKFTATVGTIEEVRTSWWRRHRTMRLEFAAFDAEKLSIRKALTPFVPTAPGPLEAHAWYPRHGWTDTGAIDSSYRAALEELRSQIVSKEDADYGKSRSSLSHESQTLVNSVLGLLKEIDGHYDAYSSDAKASDTRRTIERLKRRAKATRYQVDLFRMQRMDSTHASDIFSEIGGTPATFRDDLLFLASLAARLGVAEAQNVLHRSEIEIDVEGWEQVLIHLTSEQLSLTNAAELRFHDKRAYRRRNLNVLAVCRLLANAYKHSMIDFMVQHAVAKAAPQTASVTCDTPAWTEFAKRFSISISPDTMITVNQCGIDKLTLEPKRRGTHEVLLACLTHDAWKGSKGRVSRRVTDSNARPLTFTVELALPQGFWATGNP